MSTQRRNAIESAYLKGVRSVLLIDDQFPSYEYFLKDDERRAFRETHRAVKLWQGFRELGWACDIVPEVERLHDEYVRMRDMIVLDYELKLDDGGASARRFLRRLVEDARQHLVIIYTNEDLASAHRDIAVSLAGNPRAEPLPPLEGDAEDEYREWKRDHVDILTVDSLLRYVKRDEKWDSKLMAAVPRGSVRDTKRFLEYLVQERLRTGVESSFRSSFQTLQYPDERHSWVRCDNVFVVLVSKNASHDASEFNLVEYLKGKLLESLDEWKPSFLRIMLSFARGRLVEKGMIGDDRVLRDAVNEAALLFYMNHCESDAERRERVGMLYGRMLEDLLRDSIYEIEEFSRENPTSGSMPDGAELRLDVARERAGVSKTTQPAQILHRLNYFLAFEPTLPRYVQTGTVFAEVVDDRFTDFGVCTTPDCDLVPRPRSGGEAKELFPLTRMIYRPIPATTVRQGAIEEQLKKAEDSQALFLYMEKENKNYLLKLVEETGSHPAARMLLLARQGVVDGEGNFRGFKLRAEDASDDPRPVVEEKNFRVIGQLRSRYAMRLLHEAGHYLSRMGVDFVDWPPRSRG